MLQVQANAKQQQVNIMTPPAHNQLASHGAAFLLCGRSETPFDGMYCHAFLPGFALVVQRPAVSLDAATTCSWLCTGSSIRAALQQSAGSCTVVELALPGKTANHPSDVARVASFAAWIPAHANLLSSITIHWTGECTFTAQTVAALMGLSMQAAANCNNVSTSSSSTDGGVLGLLPHQRPPFRLQSYSSYFKHSPSMLSALPTASLTHLELQLPGITFPTNLVTYRQAQLGVSPTAAAALRGLSNLQDLKLGSGLPTDWIPVIGALPALTRLRLCNHQRAAVADLKLLPTQLLVLEMDIDIIQAPEGKNQVLDLSQLSKLQKLQIQVDECRSCSLSGANPLLPT